MISVAVLGRTEVMNREADVAIPVALRPRERSLIAALTLHSRSAMTADELIWILWGANAPATARKSLQNHVARIRSAGGSGMVVTAGARYQFGPGVVTDVDRAEMLVRQARDAQHEHQWEQRLELGETCMQLRRGPPYIDLPDTVEVIGERSRLEELLCQVDEDVTETLLMMGRHQEAIFRLERSVSEEPYRERRWEQLLVARFLIGNRRAALQVVGATSAALAEVGLVPSDRLTRLQGLGLVDDHHGLLNEIAGLHDASDQAPVRIEGNRYPPGDAVPFVGRRLEVARLAEAFSRSRRAGVVAVLVCGEAGIGKTTLVSRFVEDVARRGVRVAWGAGGANSQVPLAELVDVVEQLLETDPGALDRLDPRDRQAIGALLRRGPGMAPPAPGQAAFGGRELLFDALLHFLAGQGEAEPVVVVIDDLHLTAPSTRRLLRRLASARLPLLLIATIRTADPAVAAEYLDKAASDVVHLGGLGAEEVDGYLCQAAGTVQVGPGAVAWVVDQTGGNPLLLRETTQVLVKHGALDPDRSFDPPEAMRRTSDALLLMRLEGLATDTVAALHAAAVLGPWFMADDLVQLVTRADWHLGQALAVGLILPGSQPGVFEFAHQLLHDAIYRMIPEEERLELHEAAATALAERHSRARSLVGPSGMADPIFQIARHRLLAASLDPLRAVDSLRTAADACLARFAYEEAAIRFEEAAWVAVRYGMGSVLSCELEIGRGDALRQAGDPICTEVLFDAAERAEELGAGNLLAAAALALCRLGPTTATGAADDRAAVVADRALAVVTDIGLQAELAGEASLLHSMSGEPQRCHALYEQAEAAARTLANPRVLARVLPHAYLALGPPWFLRRRADLANEVAALASGIGDPSTEWESCLLAYSVHLEEGDPVVFDVARRIREISDVLREPTREWETQWVEAGIAHLCGDLDHAEDLIGASLSSAGAVAPSRVIATYGAQILAIRIDQGRVSELVDDLQTLIADQPGVAAWRGALALAAAQSERPSLALEQLSSFWDTGSLMLPGDFTWTAMAVVLARAATIVGTRAMQVDLATALSPYQGRLAWGGSCSYGPIDTALGMLFGALGDEEGAETAFLRAEAVAERLGAKLFAAEVHRLSDSVRGAHLDPP
jgi:DNA-binding SARP family transcriptional activator